MVNRSATVNGTEKLSSISGRDSTDAPAKAIKKELRGVVNKSAISVEVKKKADDPSRLFSLLCGSFVSPR